MPEDLLTPVEATPVPVRPAAEDDLTACPELGLGALATEDRDELDDLPAAPEDLVAVEVRVAGAPLLDLVMEALLVPVVLAMEPIPLLVVDPVVATLGL